MEMREPACLWACAFRVRMADGRWPKWRSVISTPHFSSLPSGPSSSLAPAAWQLPFGVQNKTTCFAVRARVRMPRSWERLLSTEFGLSGESVRTRVPQRCDDAGRDPRVNQEVCRQLGIASVVVMPVVADTEVLGVFELFSGMPQAFGERDLSAVQRLSQMVETAVRLARAAHVSANRFEPVENAVGQPHAPADDDLLDVVEMIEAHSVEVPTADLGVLVAQQRLAPQPASEQRLPDKKAPQQKLSEQILSGPKTSEPRAVEHRSSEPVGSEQKQSEKRTVDAAIAMAEPVLVPAAPSTRDGQNTDDRNTSAKKKLFWSAALNVAAGDAQADIDESHVPPMLRGLRKCDACGFPVSPGRALCVECEEKKWRGQVKRP